ASRQCRGQHGHLAAAGPARTLAASRSRRPASEAPCEGARLRRATARDAIHRRASLRRPAPRARPSVRLPATLRSARVRARTTPDAWRATPPCLHGARHDGTRPRRIRSTPATLRPPRAGGVAPRHSRSGAQRACSDAFCVDDGRTPLLSHGCETILMVEKKLRSEERRVGKECRYRWWPNELYEQ